MIEYKLLRHPGRRKFLSLAGGAALSGAVLNPSDVWAVVVQRNLGGYGKDPALRGAQPTWERKLTSVEKLQLTSLIDQIIPRDAMGSGALELGVLDFIDEWVSAPYPQHGEDLKVLRRGLGKADFYGQRIDRMLNAQSDSETQVFSNRLRDVVIMGWGTTPEAAQQLNFVGNVALSKFDGPPQSVLEELAKRASAIG